MVSRVFLLNQLSSGTRSGVREDITMESRGLARKREEDRSSLGME